MRKRKEPASQARSRRRSLFVGDRLGPGKVERKGASPPGDLTCPRLGDAPFPLQQGRWQEESVGLCLYHLLLCNSKLPQNGAVWNNVFVISVVRNPGILSGSSGSECLRGYNPGMCQGCSISTLNVGRICFQAHSWRCWQDSVIGELLDWESQFLAGRWPAHPPPLSFLLYWPLHRAAQNMAEGAGEKAREGQQGECHCPCVTWPQRWSILSLLLNSVQ